jgi:hypothetical protein
MGRIAACVVALGLFACGNDSNPRASDVESGSPTTNAASGDVTEVGGVLLRKPDAADASATIAGIAFVDSSVTGQGTKATLPSGTKVYPLGSTVSGTDGCPTTKYRTDGLIVAVIDYDGRPTSANLKLAERRTSGRTVGRAPYYIDLNPGRTLQVLGPVFENGSYDMAFEYNYAQGATQKLTASFELSRSCPSR